MDAGSQRHHQDHAGFGRIWADTVAVSWQADVRDNGTRSTYRRGGDPAFPMAGRLVAKMANDEDPDNFILMHAMGANTAGQLGSVIAGGILLSIVSKLI
jgi:hypothetical protein